MHDQRRSTLAPEKLIGALSSRAALGMHKGFGDVLLSPSTYFDISGLYASPHNIFHISNIQCSLLSQKSFATISTLLWILHCRSYIIYSVRLIERTQPATLPDCRRHLAVTDAAMSLTNCRFYEEKYPEIESFVMVNVKQV